MQHTSRTRFVLIAGVLALGAITGGCGGGDGWSDEQTASLESQLMGQGLDAGTAECAATHMMHVWSYKEIMRQSPTDRTAVAAAQDMVNRCATGGYPIVPNGIDEATTADVAMSTTDDPVAVPSTSTSTLPTTTTTTGAAEVIAECTTRSPSSAMFSADSGVYPAHFTEVAADRARFDIIQGRADPENGWAWTNENELLRWAALSPDATTRIYPGGNDPTAELVPASLSELVSHAATTGEGHVFWLTFQNGDIVDVCEQWSV